jgi:AraC family transcriptional regulator
MARVTECVEAWLDSTLRLDDLADAAALSSFHFVRTFRRTMGQTPYAYVAARRMERALRLVLHTTLPIVEIAAWVG